MSKLNWNRVRQEKLVRTHGFEYISPKMDPNYRRPSHPPRKEPTRFKGESPAFGCSWLDVPFRQKDEAKELGARWDPTTKRWYCPRHTPIAPFIAAGFAALVRRM